MLSRPEVHVEHVAQAGSQTVMQRSFVHPMLVGKTADPLHVPEHVPLLKSHPLLDRSMFIPARMRPHMSVSVDNHRVDRMRRYRGIP